MDVSKAIDKAAGAEREVVGSSTNGIAGGTGEHAGEPGSYGFRKEFNITTPATSEAQRWDGWGTALKPAIEPIILARKSLDGTVANNVLTHGVGGLNIDACRVGTTVETWPKTRMYGGNPSEVAFTKTSGDAVSAQPTGEAPAGRFPANVLLDEHAAKEMDKQAPNAGANKVGNAKAYPINNNVYGAMKDATPFDIDEKGGASRFFPVFKYQAKAPKKERPVIEREAIYGLRDDLTPEQVDHVRARLQEAGIEIE